MATFNPTFLAYCHDQQNLPWNVYLLLFSRLRFVFNPVVYATSVTQTAAIMHLLGCPTLQLVASDV
jgi:hypothetical protein